MNEPFLAQGGPPGTGAAQVGPTARLDIGLWWDQATRPTDLDIQVVLFDSTGVVIDACFFNNRNALDGAMKLSGDSKDGGVVGQPDEVVTVDFGRLPPHAATLFCSAFCTGSGTLGDVANLRVTVADTSAGAVTMITDHSVPHGALGGCTGFVPLVFTREGSHGPWAVGVRHDTAISGPRNFLACLKTLHGMMNVSPEAARELRAMQPTFNVTKGGCVRMPTGLGVIGFGLGWDAGCDVDASVVALSPDGQKAAAIFFGNKNALDGAVVHSGDNLTGAGSGDDETIKVNLKQIPDNVSHLFFTVSVFTSGSDFRDVRNEFCRIYNDETPAPKKEFIKYKSLDSCGSANSVVIGCVYRDPEAAYKPGGAAMESANGWSFTALGVPAKGRSCHDLTDECQDLMKAHLKLDAYYNLPGRAAERDKFKDTGCPCIVC